MQMKNIFITPCMICIFESALITNPDPKLQDVKNTLIASIRKAGAEYNQTGTISDSTLHEVQQPMLPNDIYIGIVNSLGKE